jgi:hypothetical protein
VVLENKRIYFWDIDRNHELPRFGICDVKTSPESSLKSLIVEAVVQGGEMMDEL